MSTLGPHVPKKGWARRWLIQSLELMRRAKLETLLMMGAMFAMGAADIFLDVRHVLVVISGHVAFHVVTFAATLLYTAALMRADMGGWRGAKEIVVSGFDRSRFPMKVIAILYVLMVIIFLPVVLGTFETGASPRQDAFHAGLLGGKYIGSVFMVMTGGNLFMFGALVATDMTEDQITEYRTIIGLKFGKTGHDLALFGFLAPVFVMWMAGPLSVPLGVLLIAWAYVGAREIIGGIDGNGEERREAETAPGLA